MQETQVWFLDWKDPLEKEMAIHFSILAWKIPRTEEPGRLQSMGSQEWLNHHHSLLESHGSRNTLGNNVLEIFLTDHQGAVLPAFIRYDLNKSNFIFPQHTWDRLTRDDGKKIRKVGSPIVIFPKSMRWSQRNSKCARLSLASVEYKFSATLPAIFPPVSQPSGLSVVLARKSVCGLMLSRLRTDPTDLCVFTPQILFWFKFPGYPLVFPLSPGWQLRGTSMVMSRYGSPMNVLILIKFAVNVPLRSHARADVINRHSLLSL